MVFSVRRQGFVYRGLGNAISQNILTHLFSCFEAFLYQSKDTESGQWQVSRMHCTAMNGSRPPGLLCRHWITLLFASIKGSTSTYLVCLQSSALQNMPLLLCRTSCELIAAAAAAAWQTEWYLCKKEGRCVCVCQRPFEQCIKSICFSKRILETMRDSARIGN